MVTTDASPEPIRAPILAALDGIRHGFFTRRGGTSAGVYSSLNCGIGSGDDRNTVLVNRARVAGAMGVTADHLLSPYQVHGANAVVAREPWAPGEGPAADGIATATPGIAIGIGTADCAPVLFADAESRVVGAAHAGWGGAINGVLEATVEAMIELDAQRDRIVVAIGPSIAQASYEVGPEFRERFLADDRGNMQFFAAAERAGHYRFDLPGYIVARLNRIKLRRIASLGLDTYADEERFFSFRRATHRGDADYGRMISAIALA